MADLRWILMSFRHEKLLQEQTVTRSQRAMFRDSALQLQLIVGVDLAKNLWVICLFDRHGSDWHLTQSSSASTSTLCSLHVYTDMCECDTFSFPFFHKWRQTCLLMLAMAKLHFEICAVSIHISWFLSLVSVCVDDRPWGIDWWISEHISPRAVTHADMMHRM